MDKLEETLFHLQTSNVLLLKKLFDSLKEIMIETNLEISKDYFKISHMNSENSICCFLELPSSILNENGNKYTCDYPSDNPLIVGINLLHLSKIFKSINVNNQLHLKTRTNDKNSLLIVVNNTKRKEISNFIMNFIELDGNKMSIPDIEFDTILKLDAKFFRKIIKEIHSLKAKFIDIKICNKQLIFSGLGRYVHRQTIVEPCSVDSAVQMLFTRNSEYVSQGTYSTKDLISVSKFSTLSKYVKIKMKTDVPLIVEFDVPELGNLKLLITTRKN